MLLKLAVACAVVALSVSPCLGQNAESPDVDPNRYSLTATVRRAWQTNAKELTEMIIATHPRGATRCSRKVNVSESIECFQRLVERHFFSQVTADSSQMRSWCLDDANPRRCLESQPAQDKEDRVGRGSFGGHVHHSSAHRCGMPAPPGPRDEQQRARLKSVLLKRGQ